MACKRHCVICEKLKGKKIECHHIMPKSIGGEDTFENCIPLCFDCHEEIGSYNPRHPKGNKFSDHELKCRRDDFYERVQRGEVPKQDILLNIGIEQTTPQNSQIYRPQYIITSIEKLKKYFIKTSQYKSGVDKLEKANSLLLVGCSGIGKTDTSIMIANNLMDKDNYNYRFVSCPKENDFENIFNLIDHNISQKEVLIFDDFLGNTQLRDSENYFNNLENLLKNIENYDNKKFIFNSRKTILEAAKVCNKKIDKLIKSNLEIEDLDAWETIQDKVNIFKLYCEKNQIWDKIVNLINEKIWNIKVLNNLFDHHNFTPFIVKMAAKDCYEADTSEYENIFLKHLNHPEDVWEKEVQALDVTSRQYINVLYSLSDNSVDLKIVNECFENYLNQLSYFPRVSLFDIHSRIDTLIHYDNSKIEFIHPSLIDYLNKKITFNERENIIKSAIYLEQVEKLDINKRYVKELMIIDKDSELPLIFKHQVLPIRYTLNDGAHVYFTNSILIQYLKYLYEFKIEDKQHEPIVLTVFDKILNYGPLLFFLNSYILLDVLELNYDFTPILSNEDYVKILYQYANSENIWKLISLTVKKDHTGYNYSEMPDYVQMQIIQVLQDIGEEKLVLFIEENIEVYIADELDNYGEDEEFFDDIVELVRDNILIDLEVQTGKDEILNTIKKYSIYNFDFNEIQNLEDGQYIYDTIENAVNMYFKNI